MNSSGSGCSAEFEDKIDPAEATIAQVEQRVAQLNGRLGVPVDSSADTRGTIYSIRVFLFIVRITYFPI